MSTSHEQERLLRLTAKGDPTAIEELWRLAERRGDPALACAAAIAGDDPVRLCEVVERAFSVELHDVARSAGEALGLVLQPLSIGSLRQLDGLEPVEEKPAGGPPFLLRHLLLYAFAARIDPDGYALRQLTLDVDGPKKPGRIALAVRVEDQVVVGVGASWVNDPTPSDCWRELRPWFAEEDGLRGLNMPRLVSWSRSAADRRVAFPVCPSELAERHAKVLHAERNKISQEHRVILSAIAEVCEEEGTEGRFDYTTEWTGFFPCPTSHDVEVGGRCVGRDLPGEWGSAAFDKLETQGFIQRLARVVESDDGMDTRTHYRFTESGWLAVGRPRTRR